MPNWTKEQQQAIEKSGCNIIVSAGAGSGKTAVLSERVLTKLKNHTHITSLLILTFTNAAASEMKERIRKKIKKDPSLKHELESIDNAYITTFDAYALSLVKKYSHLLNIEDVTITDSSIIKLQKEAILDDIFNDYYQKKDPKFEQLIELYCLKDDQEIKQLIDKVNSALDMIYNKQEYIENYFATYLTESFISTTITQYEKYLQDIIHIIEDELKQLSGYCEEKYYQSIMATISNLINAKTYDDIIIAIPEKLPNLPRGSAQELKDIKESITKQLKTLKTECSYQDSNEIKHSLELTKNQIKIILTIIKEYDLRIKTYKEENAIYDFLDISKLAISILENHSDIKEDIKNSFEEILIDEYQDTNDMQELFISYIENNNIYMVGDIKQSIYRFRNANPIIMKNKYDQYSNNINGFKIDLNKNFRSREEVINNINELFIPIMSNEIGGANYQETHQMQFGNITYNNEGKTNQNNNIEILTYDQSDYSKEEIEIFTTINSIKQKMSNNYIIFDKDTKEQRKITYSDFCILVDRSTSFDLYKKIFEYENIPLTIYKDESITTNINIPIIKNIYTLIDKISKKQYDKIYEYCYISISRSYLLNTSDQEIFKSISTNTTKDSRLYQICSSISTKLNNLTNQEILECIIDEFNIYEHLINIGDIKNHIIIFEYLLELSESFTFEDFKNYLTAIYDQNLDIRYTANKDDNDSVKLMTIHKSKGLEFPICYFEGLYKEFNISDLKDKFLFDKEYGIITPYQLNGLKTTILKTLLKNKYLKDEISEKIRLFYVALTRAKEKMILILPTLKSSTQLQPTIPDYQKMSYRSIKDILTSIESIVNKYIVPIDITKINITKDYNLIRHLDYQKILPSSNEVITINEYLDTSSTIKDEHFSKSTHQLYDISTYNNINLGLTIHELLETIDFSNPDYTNIPLFIKQKIASFIKSDILLNTINIYKEYEFIYTKDNTEYHGIIDLLLEYQDHYNIVDYKLKNIQDKAYLTQLNGYKNYIETITNKPTNIYLYSIMDEELIKINNID